MLHFQPDIEKIIYTPSKVLTMQHVVSDLNSLGKNDHAVISFVITL